MKVLQYLRHYTALYKFGSKFFDDIYSVLKRTHFENFFHHINNLHQNIKFTVEEKSNEDLAFLDTLLKRNNGKISNQYLLYSAKKQIARKVMSPIQHIPLSAIKMT